MLLKLFKSNSPLVIFLIPLVCFTLWLPSLFGFFNTAPENFNQAVWPGYQLISNIVDNNNYLFQILGFIMLLIQSFYIIRLNYKHIFIDQKTYLVAIIFVLLASVFTKYQTLHPALIANLFVLISIDKVFLSENNTVPVKNYFDTGLAIGIAGLFYTPVLLYIFVFWILFAIMQTFNWRTIACSLTGLLLPFVFLTAYNFVFNNQQPNINIYFEYFAIPPVSYFYTIKTLLPLIITALLTLIAIINTLRIIGLKKISTRKQYMVFLWIILFTIAIHAIMPGLGAAFYIFLIFPVSAMLTMYFKEISKKWLSELVFTILVLSIVALILL